MSDSKKYVIVSTLLQYGDMTLVELAQKTTFSVHIIKNKITELNQLLKQEANIISIEQGYRLNILDHERFDRLFSGKFHALSDFNSSGKRKAYILKCLVDKPYTLKSHLADVMQVADTTLTKDLRQLRDILADFQLVLSGKPNRGLQLTGEESQIRLVLIHHVIDYLPDAFRLTPRIQTAVDHYAIAKNIEKKSHDLLEKSLAVTLYRLSSLHGITPFPYYYNKALYNQELESLFEKVETEIGLTLSYYEKEFIQFPVYVYFNQLTEIALADKDKTVLETVFQEMISEVEKQFLIKIDQDLFLEKISTHLITMLNRIIFHVKPSDIFIGEIETSFPVASKMARVALNSLANMMQTTIETAELGYLTVHFELLLQERNQQSYHHVAIVSNGSLAIQTMIKQRIADIVGSKTQITTLTELAAKQTNMNQYDVIFSTVYLDHTATDAIIVRISHLFDEERLSKVWLDFQYGNHMLLDEEIIYQQELQISLSYQENMSLILDTLVLDQLIDDTFINQVQQNYFVENGIVFPHATNTRLTEPVLSIATSKDGIVLEDEKIYIIFLLAVPSMLTPRTEKMTLDIYDMVFNLMRHSHLRNTLLNIESLTDLVDFLNQGGTVG